MRFGIMLCVSLLVVSGCMKNGSYSTASSSSGGVSSDDDKSGVTYRRHGNSTHASDGTVYSRLGNAVIGSDDTICHTLGAHTVCN